jgi:flavin-binding protein dodecin
MSEKVYQKVRLSGCSSAGIEKAIELAINQAGKNAANTAWFEVVEIRGALADNKVVEWQVTVDIGYKCVDGVRY